MSPVMQAAYISNVVVETKTFEAPRGQKKRSFGLGVGKNLVYITGTLQNSDQSSTWQWWGGISCQHSRLELVEEKKTRSLIFT